MRILQASLTLFLLAVPSLARAQAIPPAGEPPPPEARAAEQTAIEQQARDEYAREHAAELKQQAEAEVEAERRAAWVQRGKDLAPPLVQDKRPAIEIMLTPFLSASGAAVGIGGLGGLKVRFKRYIAVQAEGGVLGFRPEGSTPSLLTAVAEPSVILWGQASKFREYRPEHVGLRLGMQLLFPIASSAPDVQPQPSAFIAPFLSLTAISAFGTLYRSKGFFGLRLEPRFGYRFAVGADSPMEGWMVDLALGAVMGF